VPDIWIESIDLEKLKDIGRNSPKVLAMELISADGIYRNIYNTAPHAEPSSDYNYRDNFRIENRLFPMTQGHVTYIIAERFQWRWIEYGWTQWRDHTKYPGKYIMTNALRAYAFGPDYGEGVIE
jgi:hypothetical protein